jgi:arabinose-5-phosphate isomerase
MSMKDKDIAVGQEVLRLEAAALEVLAGSLDGGFAETIKTLLKVKGRVIVTGMGKSGHVARKIAATLASTGTPALFVHPGEASHGDLGMIEARDAVLALSYSGKAPELRDLVAYTRRFEIPLIAMTGNAKSHLAEAADIVLLLPKQPEAGTLALAPTTSTTMQMALGDALAVALFERRGFTPEDFRVFHPGGSLGKQLVRVRDLMHEGRELPLVPLGMKMAEALLEMSAKGFGCLGIVGGAGNLEGIITDGDLRRHMSPTLMDKQVEEVMTHHPRTIRPAALAAECLAVMTLHKPKVTNIFVVEDEKPVGLVHVHDLLKAGVA